VTGSWKEICRLRNKVAGLEEGRKVSLVAGNIIPYPDKFKTQDKMALEKSNELVEMRKKAGYREMSARKQETWNKLNKADSYYIKDGFNSGGYEWCVKNWGTKWGFVEVSDCAFSRSHQFWFDTAWSPPVPLIRSLGEQFPKLTFSLRYSESGNCFRGKLVIKKGVCITDESQYY